MRTGTCTVQQALTAEASEVLKHSLGLARRRGHAQVTPLHVAATLLSSTTTTTLFRRACLRSHPLHPNSHPLHCRALELCFNVALNRLPTTPSSSPSILPPQPSLSNALIAALKRAQAYQRRGCIEQQQQNQHQTQHQQQQQQPLLAIKVEVEQLIISILDDPSVSRVMREAGFSSTCVKNNLEESSSSTSPSTFSLPPPPPPPPPPSFFDSHSFWHSPPQLLRPPHDQNPPLLSSRAEDLKVVIDGLVGRSKRRRCGNAVIVGDSVSYCESLVAELMGKVERGEVPEELSFAHFVRFHLSPVQIKFMSRGDVETKVAELRRKVGSLGLERKRVVIYLGDLRWAVADDCGAEGYSYKPADHVIAEVARMQSEWRCGGGGSGSKVWLIATASYQTHMRCQMKQPSLEAQWSLQAVVVPSGGLTLSINAPSSKQESPGGGGVRSFLGNSHKPFSRSEEGQEKLTCCRECSSYFEKEASHLKKNTTSSSLSPIFPFWMQPHYKNDQQEEMLDELRRKWNRICQSLHQNMSSMCPPFHLHRHDFKNQIESSTKQLWPTTDPHSNPSGSMFSDSDSISISHFPSSNIDQSNGGVKERNLTKQWFLGRISEDELRTDLALSNTNLTFDPVQLERRLKENMPWQGEVAGPIVDALLQQRSRGKGSCLLLRGTDRISIGRLPIVLAEFFGHGSKNVVWIDMAKLEDGKLEEGLRRNANCVVVVEGIDRADDTFLHLLSRGLKCGSLRDSRGVVSISNAIFVLSSDSSSLDNGGVIEMRLQVEEARRGNSPPGDHLKRKAELEATNEAKIPRMEALDLNLCVDEEDNISSDLTHEEEARDLGIHCRCFKLDACHGRPHPILEHYLSRLVGSYEEVRGDGGELSIDEEVVERLVGASGSFTESLFESWLKEVFQNCLATVENGGKLRLAVEGKAGNVCVRGGFGGSVLPRRISAA